MKLENSERLLLLEYINNEIRSGKRHSATKWITLYNLHDKLKEQEECIK